MKSLQPVPVREVTFSDPFFSVRQATNHAATLPHIEGQMRSAGRFAAIENNPASATKGFWHADVIEWIEAASLDMLNHPSPRVEALITAFADSLAPCLQSDGCLEQVPGSQTLESRWRDMRDNHRLYALGHFMEAAVAWFRASGQCCLWDNRGTGEMLVWMRE